MARFNTVVARISLKDSDGVKRSVVLSNLQCPVKYKELAECISKMGEDTVIPTNVSLTFSSIRLSHIPQVHLQDYIQAEGHNWTVHLR
jgi:hypothetical protein